MKGPHRVLHALHLNILAQSSLWPGFLKVCRTDSLHASGRWELDGFCTAKSNSNGGLAVWCCGRDGIATWGLPRTGGYNSDVRDKAQECARNSGCPCWFSEEPSGGDSSDPMYGGDCLADQLQLSVMALGFRVAPSAGRNSCLVRQRINQYQPEIPSTFQHCEIRDFQRLTVQWCELSRMPWLSLVVFTIPPLGWRISIH